jgi:hypothetical protein
MNPMALQAHDLMPMFTVTNRWDGATIRYRDVWQRKNLLLTSIPSADPATEQYIEALRERSGELGSEDVQIVVTSEAVDGIPSPGVAIADRWGEIYFVQGASRAADLPVADELVDWLRYVQTECPECQGERR